jgi:hypothetical protein
VESCRGLPEKVRLWLGRVWDLHALVFLVIAFILNLIVILIVIVFIIVVLLVLFVVLLLHIQDLKQLRLMLVQKVKVS